MEMALTDSAAPHASSKQYDDRRALYDRGRSEQPPGEQARSRAKRPGANGT